jgi:acyl carrier protein
MDQAAIYDRLTGILRDVFDDDDLVARPDLTADQVDGWDSFAHLRLMFAVEKAFKVNFAASQIASLKNVGELVELIEARVSKA